MFDVDVISVPLLGGSLSFQVVAASVLVLHDIPIIGDGVDENAHFVLLLEMHDVFVGGEEIHTFPVILIFHLLENGKTVVVFRLIRLVIEQTPLETLIVSFVLDVDQTALSISVFSIDSM